MSICSTFLIIIGSSKNFESVHLTQEINIRFLDDMIIETMNLPLDKIHNIILEVNYNYSSQLDRIMNKLKELLKLKVHVELSCIATKPL